MKFEKGTKIKLFVSHGHDNKFNAEVISWLKNRKFVNVQVISFERSVLPGETASIRLPALAYDVDAAIILATPDDVGGPKNSELNERARQNVWMEFGFFWAKLGLKRIVLIRKGNIELPRNLAGVTYLEVENSISEKGAELSNFLKSLYTQEPDHLTEILYTSADATKSDAQWKEVWDHSIKTLTISGIANKRLPDLLQGILTDMRLNKLGLILELVVMHPSYLEENKSLIEDHHGFGTESDNKRFYRILYNYISQNKDLDGRIHIYAYKCLINCALVVADGDSIGGTMLARIFLRKARELGFRYPHFKLKKRSASGTFNLFWDSLMLVKTKNDTICLKDNNSIQRFIEVLNLNI